MTDPNIFDGYAQSYAATVDQAIRASGESVDYFTQLKVDLAREHVLSPVRTLMDFGCGIGNSTRALATAFPEARLTGIDPSTASIDTARSLIGPRPDRIEYVAGKTECLPFPDESFDVAFTACVFHHIERKDHEHWAREIHRVLRPGAPFFIFEHNPLNPLTRRVVRDCPFDEGVTLLQPAYARRMLRRAGFVAAHARYYFFFPRALAALRFLEPALRRVPLGGQYYVVAARPPAPASAQ
jgi:ubiquinone/menaquinone biosynthesis C-methylase UbiE